MPTTGLPGRSRRIGCEAEFPAGFSGPATERCGNRSMLWISPEIDPGARPQARVSLSGAKKASSTACQAAGCGSNRPAGPRHAGKALASFTNLAEIGRLETAANRRACRSRGDSRAPTSSGMWGERLRTCATLRSIALSGR